MIEAIASALYEIDAPSWRWTEGGGPATVVRVTWADATEESKARYIEKARAALATIRTAPPAVIDDIGRRTGLASDQVRAALAAFVDGAFAGSRADHSASSPTSSAHGCRS